MSSIQHKLDTAFRGIIAELHCLTADEYEPGVYEPINREDIVVTARAWDKDGVNTLTDKQIIEKLEYYLRDLGDGVFILDEDEMSDFLWSNYTP